MKTIFYSWQSDIDGKLNNNFIKTCIEKAIKKINKEVDFQCSLDKDTKNEQGSPDIVDTILSKIRASDIFIGDITIVNSHTWIQRKFNKRKTPNPNVLVELGYAVKTLGWKRVICINNLALSNLRDLPFDIRNNRISVYNLVDLKKKKDAENELVSTLVIAIKSILDNYDKILTEVELEDNIAHDKALFYKFESVTTQSQLFESINFAANNLRSNGIYYKLWRRITEFGNVVENSFLNDDIQRSLNELVKAIDGFHTMASLKFFSIRTPGQIYASEFEEQGLEITENIQYEIDSTNSFSFPKEPHDNDWAAYHERQHVTQNAFFEQAGQIESLYKTFRLEVKKKLFI